MMNSFHSVADLRANHWNDLPVQPGIYWWSIPKMALKTLKLESLLTDPQVKLKSGTNSGFLLYVGIASNLRQSISMHSEQNLTHANLKSGVLSAFRLTLLSLTQFDYYKGKADLNAFMDTLSICYQVTNTKQEAEVLEKEAITSTTCFPLNIQNNKHPALRSYLKELKKMRTAYKSKSLIRS